MRTASRSAALLALAALAALVSCDGGPAGPGVARISIRRAPPFSGVVGERLDTTFVIQYRDKNGAPRRNAQVLIHCSRYDHPSEPCLLVRPLGSTDPTFYAFNFFATDDQGRLTLEAKFHNFAGTSWIHFRDPDAVVDDSVQFAALPGPPASVRVSPADTSVRIGQTVALRGRVLDSYGNERTDAVNWGVTGPAGELAAPAVVRGLAYGRAKVRVGYATFVDSVWVSVVPAGVLATVLNYDGPGSADLVHIVNTDGTGRVGPVVSSTCIRTIGWAPTGDRLTYTRDENPYGCFDPRIYIATIATGAQTRLRPTIAPLLSESQGRMGWSGPWYYFVARTIGPNGELWRVKANGDSASRVGPESTNVDFEYLPSASPDGAEVVYSSERNHEGSPRLRILTVATGAVRDFLPNGVAPSWSPDGTRIAYIRDGRFRVRNVDLTGSEITLETPTPNGLVPPSWSPDGQWLVVTTGESVLGETSYIVQVSTGLAMPLGWTHRYSSAAWKPVP